MRITQKMLDRIGQRFGRLILVRPFRKEERTKTNQLPLYWEVQCDCGVKKEVLWTSLHSKKTKSCGCLHRDSPLHYYHITHGLTNSPTYHCWRGILARCATPSHRSYANYGGRGIGVCERWLDFENFFQDMGHRPSEKHSLDRIDNDGNYCPENCRWAEPKEQQRNKRNTRFVHYNGRTIPIQQACEEAGILSATVYSRVHRKEPESTWFRPVTK